MLRWYKADLHIHSVLSACAELSMGPREIVHVALYRGLDIIAITDHNSAENVPAVMDAALGSKLIVIPGMEVYTREEAHMICLFPDLERVMAFQRYIYEQVFPGEYDDSMFGPQLVCDKDENILAENKRFLSLPLKASLQDISNQVVQNNGLIYPAHIDRKSHSLLRVLGFIPNNLPIHAVEIFQSWETARAQHRFLNNTSLSIVTASDAHDITQIGQAFTYFKLAEPSFEEVSRAIQKKDGRETSIFAPQEVEKASA